MTLVFIWMVEIYSIIQNAMFIGICFDVFVVVGFIHFRWKERKQQSTSAKQRSLKVGAKCYPMVIFFNSIGNNWNMYSNVILILHFNVFCTVFTIFPISTKA